MKSTNIELGSQFGFKRASMARFSSRSGLAENALPSGQIFLKGNSENPHRLNVRDGNPGDRYVKRREQTSDDWRQRQKRFAYSPSTPRPCQPKTPEKSK
jgi:hypothetical protein